VSTSRATSGSARSVGDRSDARSVRAGELVAFPAPPWAGLASNPARPSARPRRQSRSCRGIWAVDEPGRLRVDREFHQVDGAKRGPAPAHPIPIRIGALKPRMPRLTGRLADGWLPSSTYLPDGPASLTARNAHIDEGATGSAVPPEEAAGSVWPPPCGWRTRYVFRTGRREAELEAAVKTLGVDRATAVVGDISKPSDLDRLYDAVRARGKGVDVLVANAAVGASRTLEQTTEEHLDQTFGVNVRGTLFTVQKALPLLNDGASIVLVGSTAGDRGVEAFDAYAASKAAVRSFARTWSNELKGRGIRVDVVSPAWIETPGGTAAFGDEGGRPGRRGECHCDRGQGPHGST
jgi:hypothetical protein